MSGPPQKRQRTNAAGSSMFPIDVDSNSSNSNRRSNKRASNANNNRSNANSNRSNASSINSNRPIASLKRAPVASISDNNRPIASWARERRASSNANKRLSNRNNQSDGYHGPRSSHYDSDSEFMDESDPEDYPEYKKVRQAYDEMPNAVYNQTLEEKIAAAKKDFNERRLKEIEELRNNLDSGKVNKELVQRRIHPLAMRYKGTPTPILDELAKRVGPGTAGLYENPEMGSEEAEATRIEKEVQERVNRRLNSHKNKMVTR